MVNRRIYQSAGESANVIRTLEYYIFNIILIYVFDFLILQVPPEKYKRSSS